MQHSNTRRGRTSNGSAHPRRGPLCPSPSGRMHLGNVFSCLCAWLSARSQGGSIVLRIEDLDDRCKRPELAAQLIDDLAWLGLEWDEGPYYQHDRLDLYEDALRQLQDAGLTYPCFCTRAELHVASAPHASDGTPIYRGACPRAFCRRGCPPQCPARSGHAFARARRR